MSDLHKPDAKTPAEATSRLHASALSEEAVTLLSPTKMLKSIDFSPDLHDSNLFANDRCEIAEAIIMPGDMCTSLLDTTHTCDTSRCAMVGESDAPRSISLPDKERLSRGSEQPDVAKGTHDHGPLASVVKLYHDESIVTPSGLKRNAASLSQKLVPRKMSQDISRQINIFQSQNQTSISQSQNRNSAARLHSASELQDPIDLVFNSTATSSRRRKEKTLVAGNDRRSYQQATMLSKVRSAPPSMTSSNFVTSPVALKVARQSSQTPDCAVGIDRTDREKITAPVKAPCVEQSKRFRRYNDPELVPATRWIQQSEVTFNSSLIGYPEESKASIRVRQWLKKLDHKEMRLFSMLVDRRGEETESSSHWGLTG